MWLRNFKIADLILQIILGIACIYGLLLRQVIFTDETNFLVNRRFDYSYAFFGLGALQLISTALHFFLGKPFWKSKIRIVYYAGVILTFLLLAIMLISEQMDTTLIIGFSLLIITPLLGLYYMIICGIELKRLKIKN